MNDASTRFALDQTGAATLLPGDESDARVAELAESAWATEEGLRGATARELFNGYCQRLSALNVVIVRAYVSTQTLHPQWSGYGYTWRRDLNSVREQQYARGPVSPEWLSSPFNALIERSRAGEKNPWLRRRLELGPNQRDFPALVDFYEAGATDYLCLAFAFGESGDPSHGDWSRLFFHDRSPRRLPRRRNSFVAFYASGVVAGDESSCWLRHRFRAPADLPWK
jgi:hypothetical protein